MKQKNIKDNNNADTVKTVRTITTETVFLWFITIGMLLIAAGTVMPLLMQDGGNLYKYVYGGGAAMLLVGRLFTPYKGDNPRLKRLYRIEGWAAIFFCAAAFLMFYEAAGTRDWLAFTLAGGAIQIYTSIMIPRTVAKGNNR